MPRPYASILTQSDLLSGPGQGLGRAGPVGPPGPAFRAGLDLVGTSIAQNVAGFRSKPLSTQAPVFGQAYVYDGAEWLPQELTGGIPRLSRTLYVDATTGSFTPDGSIAAPFPKLSDALAIINASALDTSWYVIVGAGLYTETAVVLSGARRVVIEGPQTGSAVVEVTTPGEPGLRIVGGGGFDPETVVEIRNMTFLGDAGLGIVVGRDTPYTSANRVFLQFVSTPAFDTGDVFVTLDAQWSTIGDVGLVGGLKAQGCAFVEVDAGFYDLQDSSVQSGIAAFGDCTMVGCRFGSAAAVFIEPGGSVSFDGVTSEQFQRAAAVFSGGGRIVIADRGSTVVLLDTFDNSPLLVPLSIIYGYTTTEQSTVVDVYAVARGSTKFAGFRKIAAYRYDGTAAQTGSTADILVARDDASWDLQLSFSDEGASGWVNVQVTGDASEVVNWTIVVKRGFAPFDRI